MIYREYDAKISQGLGKGKRKFGMLGECHYYTLEEKNFALNLLQDHDVLMSEGDIDYFDLHSLIKSSAILPVQLLCLPFLKASLKRFNRELFHFAEKAKKHKLGDNRYPRHIRVLPLEKSFPLTYPQVLAFNATFSLDTAKNMARSLYYEDPYAPESKLHQDVFSGNFTKFGSWMANLAERDKDMANRAYFEMIGQHKNTRFLLNFGLAHFPGVERNLESKFDSMEMVNEILV